MMTFTKDIERLATDWFRRCRESQMVHYEYASLLEKRHLWLGASTMVLSTIVGTAVFSSWEATAVDNLMRTLLGMLSLLAAAMAALQTFLNFSDRAAQHKSAGVSYGAIRRELELIKTVPPKTEEEIVKMLQIIKLKMDELAEKSPGVQSKFKQKIDQRLNSKMHRRIYELSVSNNE